MTLFYTVTNDKNECIDIDNIEQIFLDGDNLQIITNICNHKNCWFTDKKSILYYISNGTYIVEIYEDIDQYVFGKKFLLSDINTFKYLRDLDVDLYSFDGLVFKWASFKGYENIVCYLLQDINMNDTNILTEAFNYACQNGHVKIMTLLTDFNSDVNIDDAFILACENGHYDIVRFIVKRKSIMDHCYDQALCTASENGHYSIIKFLLECGANPNTNDGDAFHLACQEGHFEIVKILIQYGAVINSKNNKGLHLASKYGRIEIVRLILTYGIDVATGNNKALRSATANGHTDIVKILLENGADMTVLSCDKSFIEACKWNYSSTVIFLLQNGLNILVDNDTIKNSHSDIIRLFNDYGIKIDV